MFGSHLVGQNLPLVSAFFGGDSQLELGFAVDTAEDGGAGKQPLLQGRQFDATGLTNPAGCRLKDMA